MHSVYIRLEYCRYSSSRYINSWLVNKCWIIGVSAASLATDVIGITTDVAGLTASVAAATVSVVALATGVTSYKTTKLKRPDKFKFFKVL